MSSNDGSTPLTTISVLGPPGAGKGTLCAHLARKYSLAHYSVGDGLREWMRENVATPLAASVQDKLDNQGFLTSQELNPFISTALKTASEQKVHGLMLDGYPRCLEQLQSLDTWPFELPRHSRSVEVFKQTDRLPTPNLVLAIRVNKSKARERYTGRSRDVRDSAEKFERRFAEYEAETLPVLEIYRERGILVEVDADGTKEESIRELEQRLRESAVWKGLES